jgi:hypothetical protein
MAIASAAGNRKRTVACVLADRRRSATLGIRQWRFRSIMTLLLDGLPARMHAKGASLASAPHPMMRVTRDPDKLIAEATIRKPGTERPDVAERHHVSVSNVATDGAC